MFVNIKIAYANLRSHRYDRYVIGINKKIGTRRIGNPQTQNTFILLGLTSTQASYIFCSEVELFVD